MFDHLDDPDGFRPDDAFHTAVRRRGGRLRRRNRLAVLSTTVVGCLVLSVGGVAVFADRRLDGVERVDIGPADDAGADTFDQPFNVLVVGTDDQPGVEGIRSDTIMVVRFDPATDQAAVLPLPRDLFVAIPGHADESRINQAFVEGGPELLVETVEALGLPVDHYVSIDFAGMQAMVDGVDGVQVNFPVPMRDATTGLDVEAGCGRLDGRMALALARSRHVETYVDGAWVRDVRGDLGRIERQVLLGRIMLSTFNRLGRSWSDLDRLTRLLADNATVDAGLSNRDLVAFAGVVQRVEPDAVADLVLPVSPQRVGGAEVLVLDREWVTQLEIMDGTKPEFFTSGAVEPPQQPPTIQPC
jgi:LCP family protein required for cell wall assembly